MCLNAVATLLMLRMPPFSCVGESGTRGTRSARLNLSSFFGHAYMSEASWIALRRQVDCIMWTYTTRMTIMLSQRHSNFI